MANGDSAAGELGFTPVSANEDYRNGYDGINRAADLAAYVSKTRLKTAAGKVQVNTSKNATTKKYEGQVTVNFPTGRFSSAPTVTTGIHSTATAEQSAHVGSVSSTQVTIHYSRDDDQSPVTIGWIAAGV